VYENQYISNTYKLLQEPQFDTLTTQQTKRKYKNILVRILQLVILNFFGLGVRYCSFKFLGICALILMENYQS
jgi:hypothetical protein